MEAVHLEAPFPPFLYCWSPCGTRLAMLSNWHLRQCGPRRTASAYMFLLGGSAAHMAVRVQGSSSMPARHVQG